MAAEATIIIPNYKTLELTKLCLRSLHLHTDIKRVKVIVVDNDSADASLDYLRSVEWITLVERKTAGESGPLMHERALDLGVSLAETPYIIAFHTDTIVTNSGWLDFMLAKVKADPNNAGTGSWKLEEYSPLKKFFQKIETAIRRLLGRKITKRPMYFRTHCVLYKTAIVRECGGFVDPESAGIRLFAAMKAKGYGLPFIEPREFRQYIKHLNNATMIMHPEEYPGQKVSRPRAQKRLQREWESLNPQEILQNSALDKL